MSTSIRCTKRVGLTRYAGPSGPRYQLTLPPTRDYIQVDVEELEQIALALFAEVIRVRGEAAR